MLLVHSNGDNHIQNFLLGRYIVGYMVGNLVLWRRVIYLFKHCLFLTVSLCFCRVVITFVNSLNPDQDRQTVGPDFGSEPFITHIVLQKDILKTKKQILENVSR